MYCVYAKIGEHLSIFEPVMCDVPCHDVQIFTEHAYSYFELDHLIDIMTDHDVLCVSCLGVMGTLQSDLLSRLQRILGQSVMLAVMDIPATYQFGFQQPMNKAVLEAVLQGLMAGQSGVTSFCGKSGKGRPKIQFPEKWPVWYEMWDKGELSSGEFLKLAGVKKATFYNLITDYRDLLRENQKYMDKYRIG